jgi:hypothetical protein
LDWRRSYEDNRIAELKEEFQGGANRGAATIISKASSDERVPLRKTFQPTARREDGTGGDIDPKTGKKLYKNTNEETYKYRRKFTEEYKDDSGQTKTRTRSKEVTVFKDKNGDFYYKDKTTGEREQVPADKVKTKFRTETSNKMTEIYNKGGDAYDLVFDKNNRIENYYASYANRMKLMANEARKEYLATPNPKVNKSARQTYAAEVDSLTKKLNGALKNAPRERQAVALAYSEISKIKKYNPEIANDKDAMKKKRAQVMDEARVRTGALKRSKRNIEITDREWEAIQANAVSNETLKKIFRNTDSKKLKERAMPRNQTAMTSAATARARAMLNMGYTREEAADALGVSVSTLDRAL